MTIDEILKRFKHYIYGEIWNNFNEITVKQEIQELIDEAVEKEIKKLREFTKSLTKDHGNLLKQIPIMIDEAVEKERKRILDREKIANAIPDLIPQGSIIHPYIKLTKIGKVCLVDLIIDSIIKESGGKG